MPSVGIYRPVIAVILISCVAVQVKAQDDADTDAARCLTEEHQKVAFLTGKWAVVSRQRVSPSSDDWIESQGEARWRPILGGCVMEESWSGVVGDTHVEWIQLVAFNSRTEAWERSLVDTGHGNLLRAEGYIDDGNLIFNHSQMRNGQLLIDRTTFEPVDDDSFQVILESSFDGGKSWTTLSELHYSRQ